MTTQTYVLSPMVTFAPSLGAHARACDRIKAITNKRIFLDKDINLDTAKAEISARRQSFLSFVADPAKPFVVLLLLPKPHVTKDKKIQCTIIKDHPRKDN